MSTYPHVFTHVYFQVHAKSDGAPLCDWCDRRESDPRHVTEPDRCPTCERAQEAGR